MEIDSDWHRVDHPQGHAEASVRIGTDSAAVIQAARPIAQTHPFDAVAIGKDGIVNRIFKTFSIRVRAVRGGP